MLPPISTLIGEVSFINNQAHKGPNTASVSIKMPTTAEGVVCDPIVIKIKPNIMDYNQYKLKPKKDHAEKLIGL